jgi:hypothetical protein
MVKASIRPSATAIVFPIRFCMGFFALQPFYTPYCRQMFLNSKCQSAIFSRLSFRSRFNIQ